MREKLLIKLEIHITLVFTISQKIIISIKSTGIPITGPILFKGLQRILN
jgi:hypothetical protein